MTPKQAARLLSLACGACVFGSRDEGYRWDTRLVRAFFRPAHQLDRRVRPAYWKWYRQGLVYEVSSDKLRELVTELQAQDAEPNPPVDRPRD